MANLKLTKPAMLAAVSYLVMAFIILLPINGPCDRNDPNCYNLSKRLLVLLLMVIPIGLSIYSINCMVAGNCVVWSWVNSIFIAAWVLLFLLATVLSFDNRQTVNQVYIIEEGL
jgi:hypothetical protein